VPARPAIRSTTVPAPARRPSPSAREVPIGAYIDHTYLNPLWDERRLATYVTDGIDAGVATLCVLPAWVAQTREALDMAWEVTPDRMVAHAPGLTTVLNYPLGALRWCAVDAEAKQAVADGATELDLVYPLWTVLDGRWQIAEHLISAARRAAPTAILKVILETAALTTSQYQQAADVAVSGGADFVKTSTGMHPAGGATVAVVAALREALPPVIQIKASGGVRTCADALAMLGAGATRLGTSNGVAIARCLATSEVPLARLITNPGAHTPCRTRGAGAASY
jgi:deoxyribose-phosphate aldolase